MITDHHGLNCAVANARYHLYYSEGLKTSRLTDMLAVWKVIVVLWYCTMVYVLVCKGE